MGCFKICFGTCNNQKVPTKQLLPSIHQDKMLVRFEPLQPTKPVVCRNKKDVLVVEFDEKGKVGEIYNLGNQNCAMLANEKEENVIEIDNVDQIVQEESSDSLFSVSIGSKTKVNTAENGDVLVHEESTDSLFSVLVESRKKFNGLDDADQEESSNSLFSVSVGSEKKVNVAENGDVLAQEESSDSLFSVSVESGNQFNGLDDVDQEESSNSLFSVSVGSEKKVNFAEKGHVLAQEESSDSLFSLSVESRKHLIHLGNVDQSVQDESSDSLFSVSIGSEKKVNAAENGNHLVQEESLGVSFQSRKQVNAVETDENEVNSRISSGVKPVCKHLNLSPTFANSVLGPIENLTNWKKGIKVTTTNTCIELKEHEKENMSLVQGLDSIPFSVEEPSLKKLNTISKQQMGSHSKAGGSPFAVDTSLSSWLVKSDGESSENTPILAAFTCEELAKEHSTKFIKDYNMLNHLSTPLSKRSEST